jgi:hypothetical protein
MNMIWFIIYITFNPTRYNSIDIEYKVYDDSSLPMLVYRPNTCSFEYLMIYKLKGEYGISPPQKDRRKRGLLKM